MSGRVESPSHSDHRVQQRAIRVAQECAESRDSETEISESALRPTVTCEHGDGPPVSLGDSDCALSLCHVRM